MSRRLASMAAQIKTGGFAGASLSPKAKKIIAILTALIFAAGVVISVSASPELIRGVSWPHVALLALIAAPLLTLANALEILAMGRAVKSDIRYFDCVRASVLSTASNILPIPGGTLVRIAALSANGTPLRRASGITVISGAIWFAVALAVAGAALSVYNLDAAAGFIAVAAAVAAGAIYAAASAGIELSKIMTIAGVKLVIVAIEGLRYCWALEALGVDAKALQGLVLSLSTVVGSVVAAAPGGLGVREGAAALLAVAVSLDPAAGFLSSVLNRITMYAMLAATIGFSVLRKEKP